MKNSIAVIAFQERYTKIVIFVIDVVTLSFGIPHLVEDGFVVKGIFFIFVKQCHLARATLNQTGGTYQFYLFINLLDTCANSRCMQL